MGLSFLTYYGFFSGSVVRLVPIPHLPSGLFTSSLLSTPYNLSNILLLAAGLFVIGA